MHNEATRLLEVIDSRINKNTRSSARLDVTYGQVYDVVGDVASVYIVGTRELAESDGGTPEPSTDFRIPTHLTVRPDDHVRVSMENNGTDRWIDEVFTNQVGPDPDPNAPIDYALDTNGGDVQVAVNVGTPAKVQEATGTGGLVDSGAGATLASTPTPGNILIAVFAYRGTSTAHSNPSGWNLVANVVGPAFDGGRMLFYWKTVVSGTSASLFISSSAHSKSIYLAEWSGLTAFDSFASFNNHSASTAMTTDPYTPGVAGGVLFAGFNQSSRNPSIAVNSPFTEDYDRDVDASGPSVVFGSRIVSTFSGSYTATATSSQSDGYGWFIVSFSSVSSTTFIDAPNSNDGSDSTYDTSNALISGACARISLEFERLIYQANVRIACATSGSRSYSIYGSTDAAFTSPVLLDTTAFTALGSYTAQDILFQWSPSTTYQYYEIRGDNETRRFHDINMYSAFIEDFGLVEHGALSGRDEPDQHPASAISYDNTASGADETNIQDAVDYLYENGGGGGGSGEVGRTLQRQVYTRTSGDYTTSGTTMQNIDGTNLVFTMVLPYPARVRMSQVCHILGGATANQQIFMDFAVDGTRVTGSVSDAEGLVAFRNANDTTQRRYNGTVVYTTDVLAAGSHTFSFMWSAASGTATIAASGKPRWVVEEVVDTTGGGPMRVVTARAKRTSGDVTCSADSVWTAVDTGLDLTIPAVTGDVLEVDFSAMSTDTAAVGLKFSAATIVSGSAVNDIVTGTTPDNAHFGVPAWFMPSGVTASGGGSFQYVVQAGDISSGNVTLRLFYNTTNSTNRVVEADTTHPIYFGVKNLGQPGNASRLFLPTSTSPSISTAGEVAWDSDDYRAVAWDTQRNRALGHVGWLPYAVPGNYTTGTTTSLTIAANGGTLLVSIPVRGHMLLESVSISQQSTSGARQWGWDLYVQDLNNGNSGEATLRRIAQSSADDSFTPGAASIRTLSASAVTYLGPGVYWLAIQCRHATNSLGLGMVAAGSSVINSGQTKTTTNPNGATLDAVAATWTKQNDSYYVALRGRVFGQSAIF